jgi:cytochrome b involved in lipid metabolism
MSKWIGLLVGVGCVAALAFFVAQNNNEDVDTPSQTVESVIVSEPIAPVPTPEPIIVPTPKPPTPSVKPQPVPKPTPVTAPTPTPVVVPPAPPTPVQVTVKTMTAAEVAAHNSEASCFTIVNNKVYDVTSWISKHPGGRNAILGLCGKDGTVQFMNQHGSNSNAQATLQAFFMANLQS